MRLARIPEPFSDPAFVFEPKLDGFRALAIVTGRSCKLVSRNGHVFRSWPSLASEIARTLNARAAVLDGEICCLDSDGRTVFNRLLFRREAPFFYAFDVLAVNRTDLRDNPLLERKRWLRSLLPASSGRVLYLDHVAERGADLFRVCCERDLEGIVAKWARGVYQNGRGTSWLKIKNPDYSQMLGRRELFEARREHRKPRASPPILALL